MGMSTYRPVTGGEQGLPTDSLRTASPRAGDSLSLISAYVPSRPITSFDQPGFPPSSDEVGEGVFGPPEQSGTSPKACIDSGERIVWSLIRFVVIAVAFFVVPVALFAQTTWTRYPGNPVVKTGGPGTWDNGQAFFPSVLYRDSTYIMWYGGDDNTHKFRTGRATSPDGITWQKDPLNPVLSLGPKGAWDDFEVWLPSVLYDGNRYRMWYSGANNCFL